MTNVRGNVNINHGRIAYSFKNATSLPGTIEHLIDMHGIGDTDKKIAINLRIDMLSPSNARYLAEQLAETLQEIGYEGADI
jgi:hypothetical protein